jgi:predicted RNA binding protein with dsRBD fold (UPF0201 family)
LNTFTQFFARQNILKNIRLETLEAGLQAHDGVFTLTLQISVTGNHSQMHLGRIKQ